MTEKANIGALTIDLLLENKQFKAGIKSAEADTKALGENLKRYGTFTFPIDTPMRKMVEVMKEANRKAKIEGVAFGKTLDEMAAKMKAMTMSGGIISPLKVSPLKRQFIEIADVISSKLSGALNIAGRAVTKVSGLFKNFGYFLLGMARGAISQFGLYLANSILNPINLIIRGFGKATTAVKSFVRGVIESSSSYEQLKLTLKVLLKDQDKANAAFDEARKLAANTAFSIEEITRAYTQMLTFGFDQTKIPETLLLAADAATAFGQNLDEVIRSINYLKAGRKGEALESLTRFGISRPELTKRGAKFSAGGELETSTEETLNIVFKIWEEKLGGMSKEGTKTWKGMVSNLKDAWVDFQATIGEAGFFDAVKNSLKFILDKINEWSANGTLKKWADDISTRMTNIYNGVSAIVKEILGLELTGGKTQVKEAKKMTTEEIALFVLGFTPEEFKNAMTFMSGGPGEGRSYIGVTSDVDRQKIVDDATRLGEAIHAAVKGELDTGDYFTESIGTEATAQVPAWAQSILDWIAKIKEEIGKMWDGFSSAWKGADKRGSRDAHGILPGGFEGIGRQLGEGIANAISQIDFVKLITNSLKNAANLIAIEEAVLSVGGAVGDGIVKGLKKKYPTMAAILTAAGLAGELLNPLTPVIKISGAIRGSDGVLFDTE